MSVTAGLSMRLGLPPGWWLVVGGGFLGAYTTFSTWMYESVCLLERGSWGAACWHVAVSVVMGTAATAGGLAGVFLDRML